MTQSGMPIWPSTARSTSSRTKSAFTAIAATDPPTGGRDDLKARIHHIASCPDTYAVPIERGDIAEREGGVAYGA